jgi:hypothetical protein
MILTALLASFKKQKAQKENHVHKITTHKCKNLSK